MDLITGGFLRMDWVSLTFLEEAITGMAIFGPIETLQYEQKLWLENPK